MKSKIIRIGVVVYMTNLSILVNAQVTYDSISTDLIGNWRIENVLKDGEDNPDFNSKFKDSIILREDGTHTTTDNEYEYKQEGKWSLENGNVLVLTCEEDHDTQKLEIIFLENSKMRLKPMDSEYDIIIFLVKYN